MIYKGSDKIEDLYFGGEKISEAYYGSELVYSSSSPGGIIFESDVAGTYEITTTRTRIVHVDIVGGGGGGADSTGSHAVGGQAGYISGTIELPAGTYTIVVGSPGVGARNASGSDGGSSSFFGNTAGGGGGSIYNAFIVVPGAGGTCTVVTTGLEGQNGSSGSTSGWINGYGAGTTGGGAIAGKGYVKIEVS